MTDLQRFHEDLEREDDLGVVVRAHIHVESLLNELIDCLAPAPKHIHDMRLDYSRRIDVALALGLNEVWGKPLRALGKLRNEFAHQLDAELNDNRVANFYSTFEGELKELLQRSQEETRQSLVQGKDQKFANLPPKEKFIRYAIFLYSALSTTIEQVIDRVQRDGGLLYQLKPPVDQDKRDG